MQQIYADVSFNVFFCFQIDQPNQTESPDSDQIHPGDAGGWQAEADEEEEDYTEDDADYAIRFNRLSDALSSAVALIPPPPAAPAQAVPCWPPAQPEAQVALLVAAEAASRQELMHARDALSSAGAYIAQLQGSPSQGESRTHVGVSTELSASDCVSLAEARDLAARAVEEIPLDEMQQQLTRLAQVCSLLEAAAMDYARVVRGEATTGEFERGSGAALLEADENYAILVETLKEALEKKPGVRVLEEAHWLATTNAPNLTEEERQAVNSLRKVLTASLYDSLSDVFANDEEAPPQTDTELVERVSNLLSCKVITEILLEDSKEAMLDRINSIDTSTMPDETRQGIEMLKSLFELRAYLESACSAQSLADIPTHLNAADAALVERLRNSFVPKAASAEEIVPVQSTVSEASPVQADQLRGCLRELLEHHGSPSLDGLNPEDRDLVNRIGHLFSTTASLAESITLALRRDNLEGVGDKIKAAKGDKKVLECLGYLVEGYTTARARHAQAEQEKIALGQLVRSKHAESQAYHAQLQRFLTEKQSAVSVGSEPNKFTT